MNTQYPQLSELLGHDPDKVRLVARTLYRGAAMDLQRLECAAAKHDWRSVRAFAQRIQMFCLQLAENEAAAAVADLGRVPGAWFANAYGRHQPVIAGLLSRMKHFDH